MKWREIMDLIEKERIRQGLTMSDLARLMDVRPSNVNYWKHGGGISLENADKALRVLGLTVTLGKGE